MLYMELCNIELGGMSIVITNGYIVFKIKIKFIKGILCTKIYYYGLFGSYIY